jgi:hypothetical protein
MRTPFLIFALLTVAVYNATANCTDEESIVVIEDTLNVDVLYLSRGKGSRCRAKVAGSER